MVWVSINAMLWPGSALDHAQVLTPDSGPGLTPFSDPGGPGTLEALPNVSLHGYNLSGLAVRMQLG